MRRTWIIDLSQESDTSSAANGLAFEAALSGFTKSCFGEGVRWWDYRALGTNPGYPGAERLRLHDSIPISSLLSPDAASIIVIGSADQKATQNNFCIWAARLAALEPAGILGQPGTVQKIGILWMPEDLFTVGRATEEGLAAFLAQLGNVAGELDALYLLGHQSTSKEHSQLVPPEARPYLLSQLVLHISIPDAHSDLLPRGICSAGAFAMHASWSDFQAHCSWRLGSMLWDKFMTAEESPFFDPSRLDIGKFQGATDMLRWQEAFVARAPAGPELPSALWGIPAEKSPWRIWRSNLLDHDGFFEGWLRDWVRDLDAANVAMAATALQGVADQFAALEAECVGNAETALREGFDGLAGHEVEPRSKRQCDLFFERCEQFLAGQQAAGDVRDVFHFPSEPGIREMLDSARKDIQEGRDKTVESAELRGLASRLSSHPSLLAMGLRAAFASALLVVLVPPLLAVLRTSKPESILLSVPPEVWTIAAFLAPFLLMLASVKFRHNHIKQHAQKLTILALARLEERISRECASRVDAMRQQVAGVVARGKQSFAGACARLRERWQGAAPQVSYPALPVTPFQKPLISGQGGVDTPDVTNLFKVPDREGKDVIFSELRGADFLELLRGLISADHVKPTLLAPALEPADAGGADRTQEILAATSSFIGKCIKYTDEFHRQGWAKVCAAGSQSLREICMQSAPSVEKQQGYDTKGGIYDRSSEDLVLNERGTPVSKDIRHLNGYASWMSYNLFTYLADAIPNPQTVEAAKAWLEKGLSAFPQVLEEFSAPSEGVLSIEAEPYSRVEPGALLATIGAAEWRARNEGFLVFEKDVDSGRVPAGKKIGRIVSFGVDDPRLLSIFEIAEPGGRVPATIGGGQPRFAEERVETYRTLARKSRERGACQ